MGGWVMALNPLSLLRIKCLSVTQLYSQEHQNSCSAFEDSLDTRASTVYALQLIHFNHLLVAVVLFHCLVALPGLGVLIIYYLSFVIYFLSIVGMSFVPFDNAKIERFSRPSKFPATISPQLLRPALPSATDAPHRPPSCRKLRRITK
jgi:hypothetical protein